MGLFRGGHGHADALSVVLSVGGQELLIDPGTGVYNGAPEWRNFFRSSRAHNTAIVDGREQSEPAETFSWKRANAARLVRHISEGDFAYAEAVHDGYSSPEERIVHRRRVLCCDAGTWILHDELLSEQDHACTLLYHFAP